MKNRLRIALVLFTIGVLVSCSSGDDSSPPSSTVSPSSATLVFPDDNLECTEGTVVNDLESTVTFQWQTSANTDSYEVSLRNLNTNTSGNVSSNTNQINITLERGVPYEWFVTSKVSGSSQTAKSDTWKFYNQGPGAQNYAPFPASAVNPMQGQSVNAATGVTLEWEGNDVDNDIAEFEIFFGTNADPSTSIGTTTQSSMNADISSGQTYYWRVITKDNAGNTSQSVVFDFKVL